MSRYVLKKSEWDAALKQLLDSNLVYAVTEDEFDLDYDLIDTDQVQYIIYNRPKPVTPLKMFFLPVKENVTSNNPQNLKRIIIGAPNCDVMALNILDEIYLEEQYPDPLYKQKRDNTLIISADCMDIQDNCHCIVYDIAPFATEVADLSLLVIDDHVILTTLGGKGDAFIKQISSISNISLREETSSKEIEEKHQEVIQKLKKSNGTLPGYKETRKLIEDSDENVWEKYASDCVSCGACSTICPTCSCFLLNDKPGFEKVRQMDACQYPGFERVAGGEDALGKLNTRFRNRYMCKYVWKPEKFKAIACTGCGRCIDTCIGNINKNELIMELSN